MSNENYGGGLVWSPLFDVSEKEISNFLSNLHLYDEDYKLSTFVQSCFYKDFHTRDEDIIEATRRSILRWTIDNSCFASDVLSEDEYKKARDTYKRGQYQSGVLKKLINYFLLALHSLKDNRGNYVVHNTNHFRLMLFYDVQREYNEIKNKKVEKSFEPLKKVIEQITSGVKAECYLNANKNDWYDAREFEDELNDYLSEKYGYNYNEFNLYSEFVDKSNELLQLTLVNDKNFWLNKKFFVASFVNEIYAKNSKAHAIKVLDYIFDKLLKNDIAKALIEAKLSLCYYDKQAIIAYHNVENKDVLYPLSVVENEEQKVNEGKRIFESFLYDFVYPNNKEQIRERLKSNLDSNENGPTIYGVLDYIAVKSYYMGKTRQALEIICPEFFTDESLWKRVYLKVYYISKMEKSESLIPYLFEKFYNLFAIIEHETGIETAIQLDDKSRNDSYNKLKSLLNSLGVSISDSMKGDYVTALMDIRSARMTEAQRFPVLEQLGDAIYNFAVSEMIFYNPYYNDYEEGALNPKQRLEKYISAKGQLEVAKKFELDKMYISASTSLEKGDAGLIIRVHDYFDEKDDSAKGEKYLADTLEMILGAVAIDKGYNVAILLAKRMIRDVYENDFPKEVHYSFENVISKKIDRDYCIRILPGLYCAFYHIQDYGAGGYISLMRDSLYKLLGCIVLKTEDLRKREYISYGSQSIAVLFDDEYNSISPAFYCYLTEGVDKVVEIFGKNALDKYNKYNKD